MRICFLANATSPHTVKWVRHLSTKGHEVHLLSFHTNLDWSSLDQKIVLHPLRACRPFKLGYILKAQEVRRMLSRIKPDLLHAHYATGYGTLGRLAGFHPYILSVWGSDVFVFPRRSPAHAWLLRRNLEAADQLCATSYIMAHEVGKYTRHRVLVTPFGVDCEQFKPAEKTGRACEEFVVGTVKKLETLYGIEYLIKAFQVLTRAHPKARLKLLIVGGGSLERDLRKLATKLGVGSPVEFVGAVPHTQVPECLNKFSVYVAVSLTESFGVAVLEASACGIPVVVSNVGGLPEVVREGITGFIVPPRDPEATAAAIEELLLSPELQSKMGLAGRQWVLQQYDWEKTAKVIEDLYVKITTVKGAT